MKTARIPSRMTLILGLALMSSCAAESDPTPAPPVPTAAAVPSEPLPSAPSPSEVAQKNFQQAEAACSQKFPFAPGSMSNRIACINRAGEQYLLPMLTNDQRPDMEKYGASILQAAKLVDNGRMSMQEYGAYMTLSNEILTREKNELDQASQRQSQEFVLQFRLNYDTENGNQAAIENETHDLDILKLQDQLQTLSDDRDEFQYCAGLHSKNISECEMEKTAFQTDLATYQAMASSIPQGAEAIQNDSQPALNEMELDLDAIAGGVVPQ